MQMSKWDVTRNVDTKNMTLYENYERRIIKDFMLVMKMLPCDQTFVKTTDNGMAYISFGIDNY